VRVLDAANGRELPESETTRHTANETIAYYQAAADALRNGALRMPGTLIARPVQ